jgi:hypothetical protein
MSRLFWNPARRSATLGRTMSETWHYEQNQQAKGPVSFDELQQLYSSGQITARDRVWTERLRNWMPAGQVPELGGAVHRAAAQTPAQAPAPQANVGMLSYSQPQMESLMFTPRAMELLRQTRPWARLFSVLIWIGAGLMILGGIGFALFLGAFAMSGSGSGGPKGAAGVATAILVGGIYVVLAAVYIPAAIFLGRYASRITELDRLRRADALEAALEAQKSFWKYMGIAFLAVIGLSILLNVIGGIMGALMH